MKNPLDAVEFLLSSKNIDGANKVLDVLLPYASTIPEYDAIGNLYSEAKNYEKALWISERIMEICEPHQKIDAKVNIIRALLHLNRPEEALELIEEVSIEKPDDLPNKMDRAMVYFLLNRKQESEDILRELLTKPRSKDVDNRIKFNLGTHELAKGEFKSGLRKFIVDGKKLNIWEELHWPIPQWDGKVVEGQTILVCAEAGIGDEIISVRFNLVVEKLGMKAIWHTSRSDLLEVFRRNGFNVLVDPKDIEKDWLWTYGMTMPVLLDLDYKDLWTGPYLTPKREKEILPGKFKVGIKCKGNPKYDQDLHRSLPEKQFIDCFPKDWTIYSFHIDEDINDDRVIPLKDKIKTWDDTLDYIDQMDLIVSSCTSLPHAASAMGKETIVVVPILNYYTWAYINPHSAWYANTTTVLRQDEYDNWNKPLGELKLMLEAKCKES